MLCLMQKYTVYIQDKSCYLFKYQMYAYQKKYDSANVTLLYPMTDKVSIDRHLEYISSDGVIVYVKFVDLLNIRKSLSSICDEIIGKNEKYI